MQQSSAPGEKLGITSSRLFSDFVPSLGDTYVTLIGPKTTEEEFWAAIMEPPAAEILMPFNTVYYGVVRVAPNQSGLEFNQIRYIVEEWYMLTWSDGVHRWVRSNQQIADPPWTVVVTHHPGPGQ